LEDLTIAKSRLEKRGLTLCIVRDKNILFESGSRGISGFLEATEVLGSRLRGASAADRIVGKAVALLCLHGGVRAVYASVMSRRAKEVLERWGVQILWSELVENILGSCPPEACPFESLAEEINDPSTAYKKLKALHSSLKQR
jgi:hypothetical protein